MLFASLVLLLTSGCSHPEVVETAINNSAYDPSGQITDVVAYTDRVPTVIHVEWSLSAESTSWVEYRGPSQSDFKSTPAQAFNEQSAQTTAILGVTDDSDIEFRVVSLAPNGQITTTTTATIHTPMFSTEMPRPVLAHNYPAIQAGFDYLMGSISNENSEWFIYVVNRQGKLVWSLP